MSRLRSLFWLLSFGILLMGCRNEETTLAPQMASLLGTWRLAEPDSTQAITLTVALDSANPPHDITPFKASGKAVVNDYTVRLYASVDGKISADDIGATQLGGSPAQLQFEQAYFNRLRNVVRFEQPGPNQLRLYHGGSQPGVLVYRK